MCKHTALTSMFALFVYFAAATADECDAANPANNAKNKSASKSSLAQPKPDSIADMSARNWLDIAHKYREVLQYQKAIDAYSHALSAKPGMTSTLIDRGESYEAMNNLNAALRDYEVASHENSLFGACALGSLAHIHKAQQKYAEAKKEYERTIASKYPVDRSSCYIEHALCCLELKMPAPALEDASQVLKKEAKNRSRASAALRIRALSYLMMNDQTKALSAYSEAIAQWHRPHEQFEVGMLAGSKIGSLELLNERADLYDRLGKHDLAKQDRNFAKQNNDDIFGIAPFVK